MAAKIDGLVIEIGANTSSFKQSMRDVQNEAKGISKDLKTVSESLKLDPDNVGKAADKLKLLKDQAENATKKVEVIKKAIEALNKEYDDKSSKEYTDQLKKLESQLESATREQELANQKVEQFSKNAGDAGKSAAGLGDIIKGSLISGAIKAGLESIVNLAKQLAHHLAQAAKEIAKGAWDWANAGANLIETENKVDAVFKGSSDTVKDWAKDAAHNVRVTKQVAMENASSFGNIFTNMGMATDKAASYSTQLIEVAAAQADFNNLSTEEVLQKIGSALTGNYQGLKSLGIVMNEDKVIEKALAMTHKQNKDELTDLEKTMARVELMFDGSANAVEKFKENSGSLVSLSAELKSRFADIRDEIGSKLTPIFENLFQKAADFLGSDEGKEFIDSIVSSVDDLSQKIIEMINNGELEEWLNNLKEELPQLAEDFKEFSKDIIELLPKIGELVDKILHIGEEIEKFEAKEAWSRAELQVKKFADDYDVSLSTVKSVVQSFADEHGLKVADVYNNWVVYEPQIAAKLTELQGEFGDNEVAINAHLAAASGDVEDFCNRVASTDTSGISGFFARVTQIVSDAVSGWKSLLSGSLDLPGQVSSPDQWIKNWWDNTHRAAGGPVTAGNIYQVNDDAARRKEYFIPYTNGYILNGNDTERIVNNTNNSRSYGDLVVNVNSYGTDAASIADEIGQAVNRRLRMSGAW